MTQSQVLASFLVKEAQTEYLQPFNRILIQLNITLTGRVPFALLDDYDHLTNFLYY